MQIIDEFDDKLSLYMEGDLSMTIRVVIKDQQKIMIDTSHSQDAAGHI